MYRCRHTITFLYMYTRVCIVVIHAVTSNKSNQIWIARKASVYTKLSECTHIISQTQEGKCRLYVLHTYIGVARGCMVCMWTGAPGRARKPSSSAQLIGLKSCYCRHYALVPPSPSPTAWVCQPKNENTPISAPPPP